MTAKTNAMMTACVHPSITIVRPKSVSIIGFWQMSWSKRKDMIIIVVEIGVQLTFSLQWEYEVQKIILKKNIFI